MKKELREALKNDTLYDYLVNGASELNRDELCKLAANIYYEATCRLSEEDTNAFLEIIEEDLKDYNILDEGE